MPASKSPKNPKLILIEGIPGSGKTTTAQHIYDCLTRKGVPSRLHQEGDDNPTDFAWMSVMPRAAYNDLLRDFDAYAGPISHYATKWGELVVIPYLMMQRELDVKLPKQIIDLLAMYEPYDGKLSSDEFRQMHLDRYRHFVESAPVDSPVHIFECSFLQNQINELLAFSCLDDEAIIDYLVDLGRIILPMNPLLIYLTQTDVHRTVSRVALQRVSPNNETKPNWIDRVIDYCSASPYGKKHGLVGFDGAVAFFKRRKELELKALQRIPIRWMVFTNDKYDVDAGLAEITASLPFN